MPGGEVLTLVDALETAGIRVVLVKHENAGASWLKAFFSAPARPPS